MPTISIGPRFHFCCLFVPLYSFSLSMKIGSSWCRYSCEPWRRIGVRRDSFRIYSQWWQIGNGDRRWHNTLVEYTPKSTSSHTKFKISKRKVSIFLKNIFLQKKIRYSSQWMLPLRTRSTVCLNTIFLLYLFSARTGFQTD